jgi:DNA-binding transcriptional MerR regulator
VEYRIEQLARAAGVAVDTIRFYQGKGLLDPPRREGRITWYGPTHLERLRRIRALQQRGFTLTVIRRFLEGGLEPSDEALVEAVTAPGEPATLGLDELAARSGIAAPLLKNLEQAGLLVPVRDGEDARYPAEDLEALTAGLRLVEAGIPLSALIELGAQHAAGVEGTARAAVDLFDEHVRKRIHAQETDPERAEQRLLELFNELLEASSTLVGHHFRRTLLLAARQRIEHTD